METVQKKSNYKTVGPRDEYDKQKNYYTPPQTKFWGLYKNRPVRPFVCPSVPPSMYLVSATPPKSLIGFV